MNEISENHNTKIDFPIVSVAVITYNHEKYIAEALDSILMQKVDFKYEIVVGEDYSTDNTRKILLEYVAAYPDKIKPLLHETNTGGLPNFIETLKACKGKYIALLEGDDYWTDPLKLQKQVDFMESHREYNMIFHNAEVQHYTKDGVTIEPFNPENGNRDYSANDILRSWCIPTASVLCRNEKQYRYLEKNLWLPVGDTPYFLKCASLGKLYYMAETMSVYRRVSTGFMDSGITHTPEFRLTFIKYLKTLYNDFSDILDKEIIDRKISIQYFWTAFAFNKSDSKESYLSYNTNSPTTFKDMDIYFWTAYKFKTIKSEENCRRYMQYSNPQIIFEELIHPKMQEIESLNNRLKLQDKIIHELKEKNQEYTLKKNIQDNS